jgi:hypothetical protein
MEDSEEEEGWEEISTQDSEDKELALASGLGEVNWRNLLYLPSLCRSRCGMLEECAMDSGFVLFCLLSSLF